MMDRRLLHTLRSERGTTLVEVIAAAIILVVIAGAITSLVNAAQRESGESRVIAIAGDLAQSQLEDVRSKKFASLVGLNDTATVAAGGMSFTVKTTGVWASEASDAPVGCSSTENTPEELQLRVAVEWPQMRRPVTLDTYVAAPAAEETKGNFVVQVNDRDANGVPGVLATMTGDAQTASGSTDDDGCVRFSGLDRGAYTLTVNKSGYVDKKHVNTLTDLVSVNGGETGTATYEYDHGGGVHVGFYRQTGAATYATAAVTGAWLKGAGVDSVQPVLSAGNTIAREPRALWPSTSPYELHADTCETGQAVGSVTVGKGTFPAAPVMPAPPSVPLNAQHVVMPQFGVTVDGITSAARAATFRVHVTTACGTVLPPITTGAYNATTDVWTSAKIAVPPGLLGKVCVYGQYGNGANGWRWKRDNSVHTITTSTGHRYPGMTVPFGTLTTSGNQTTATNTCTA